MVATGELNDCLQDIATLNVLVFIKSWLVKNSKMYYHHNLSLLNIFENSVHNLVMKIKYVSFITYRNHCISCRLQHYW